MTIRKTVGIILFFLSLVAFTSSCGTVTQQTPSASTRREVSKKETPVVRGLASWYGRRFQGRRTASGERFDMFALSAAHKTLPFGTRVRVRDVASGRTVVVRINDRGPYAEGRIIDLSYGAGKVLGLVASGVRTVELKVLER